MERIINSELMDLEVILSLYVKAIEFQKSIQSNHWHDFDAALLEREIREHRHWKIMEGKEIACIYSVAYQDPMIWGERDQHPSIYLHRIVTNPNFMGRRYVKEVVAWAMNYGKANGKSFIRLDTFGANKKLNDYYERCGFVFCGIKSFKSSDEVPRHYLDGELSLLEIKIQ
jgi:RimJ/RimL family protein N-acetyltransferase